MSLPEQHTLPPAPIVMVLSSEGLLCPFYVINLEDGEGITKKPQPLPTGGERVGTGKVLGEKGKCKMRIN